jgi:hypothetical protein
MSLLFLLFALGRSDMMSMICHEASEMTEEQVKQRAEELMPYRMGMNAHNQIYYYGLSCRKSL